MNYEGDVALYLGKYGMCQLYDVSYFCCKWHCSTATGICQII